MTSQKTKVFNADTSKLFNCIVWGFPLTMVFIISSLISLGISESLGGGIFIQTVLLISIFMLMALTYASLFIYLPLEVYDYLTTKPGENSMQMENSDAETLAMGSSEQEKSYEEQCMSRSVCSDIKLWTMDSSHEPKAVKVSLPLTSLDIRHFIWNIAERMSRSMNLPKSKNYEYDGENRIRFMTAMFPDVFKDMSRNTLKNFTHKPNFGNIKLDRLNRSELCFHYEDEQSATNVA